MRIIRTLMLFALLLFLSVPFARADFHEEWVTSHASVTLFDAEVYVPKRTYVVQTGRRRPEGVDGMTAIDVYESRPYEDMWTPLRRKVYIPLDEGDSTLPGAFFDLDTLYVRKDFAVLDKDEAAPAGRTVIEVSAGDLVRRVAVSIAADEDASRIEAKAVERDVARDARLLREGEAPPEGWQVRLADFGDRTVRFAVDLHDLNEAEILNVELPYEDHLAAWDHGPALTVEALIFTAVDERLYFRDPYMHVPYATEWEVCANAYPDCHFAFADAFSGIDTDKTTVEIMWRSHETPADPVAFFHEGTLYVQIDRAFRLLADGEEAPEGWQVFELDLLDEIYPDYFLTEEQLIKLTDEEQYEILLRQGLFRICESCGGSGRTADGLRCGACAGTPGYVRRTWRIACEAAPEERLMALPVLAFRYFSGRIAEADKPLPEGWRPVETYEIRGVRLCAAADVSDRSVVHEISSTEGESGKPRRWQWMQLSLINTRISEPE